MDEFVGILVMALLFALFGWVGARMRGGCRPGGCDRCAGGSCLREKEPGVTGKETS